jgi:predicted HicB family RNase H-like nuclease
MGRPSKGLRIRMCARFPATMAIAIQQEADRRGITVNDWMIWAIKHSLATSSRIPQPQEARR